MILQKTEIQQGNFAQFAKKGVDILNGDRVLIKDAGRQVQNRFNPEKMQTVFTIQSRNGDRSLNFNQTSLNALIDAFGDNTEKWAGKSINVLIFKQNVSGRFVDVAYLAPEGYELTENGLVRTGQVRKPVNPMAQNNNLEIPAATPETIGETQGQEAVPENIPF